MKKNYIKPTTQLNRTATGDDMMQVRPIDHSYDYVDAKERDDLEEDADIQERQNDYGIEPMTLW